MAHALAQTIDLYVLDECGVSPTLPTTYTWARCGTRVIVPYEAPQGRRVNVISALAPYGPQPRLAYHRVLLGRANLPEGLSIVEREETWLGALHAALRR